MGTAHRNYFYGWVLALMALTPTLAQAQSAELLRAYQSFEEARQAGDMAAAARNGRSALALADSSAATSNPELIDLLRGLGEVLALSGELQEAVLSYQRALALQESELASDHPDLVPILSALADLHIRLEQYAAAEVALQRTLDIEQAAFGERHATVLATLARQRDLYQAAGNTEKLAQVTATLERLSTVERSLTPTPGEATRHYVQDQGFATVRVFYGTNRAQTGNPNAAQFYGKARGDLQYGYLDVTVPEIHQQGELETQSRWSIFTLFADKATLKKRYVLLDKVAPLNRSDFVSALRKQVKEAPSKDVFIFVHGFNSSFEDAARRTAQLAYDIDFDGTPMMYSWPSQASTTAYTVDEGAVYVSGRKMADFLEDVVAKSGAENIHLVAHSMGNRALIEALQTYLAKRAPSERKQVFDQVVFTAPDVDRDYFLDAVPSLSSAVARITLYASDNDIALKTSETIHGAPRAGSAGADIITLPGVDTIDMSGVEADMLGHSYFAANAGAIYDLFRLLWQGDPPPRRCGMSGGGKSGVRSAWLFNVDVCQGNDILAAGVMVKRFGARARDRVRARIASLTDPDQQQEWRRIQTQLNLVLNGDSQRSGGNSR